MTKNVLICVDGRSYREMGEETFDTAMAGVDITLKKDTRSILRYSEIHDSFMSYRMDALVMEGTIPDDMDVNTLRLHLRLMLGEGLKPIIFLYVDKEGVE